MTAHVYRNMHGRLRLTGAVAAILLGLSLVISTLIELRGDRRVPVAFGTLSRPATSAVHLSPTNHSAPVSLPAVTPARDQPLPTTALTRPVRLRVSALGVSAPVEQVVTRNGVLDVPHDISHVGWWTGSVPPGSASGATVIDGHVDSRQDGKGALFDLTELGTGRRIILTVANGDVITYRVYARRIYSKTHALPMSLFRGTGMARLVLITCGGPFDSVARSYVDNVAVFAQPVGAT